MPDNERERRLEELHSGALKLDASERDEFLRLGCGGDADLRQAVDSLLGYEQKLDGFLEYPPQRTETLNASLDREPSQAGQTLGPYHLLQPIGAGGMGEVWLAEQRQPIRRRVAIKLIKAGMDTREVVARFESERQALALMEHPGIAKVFDAGATPQGRPYFVMEYVTGIPITEYCDKHRMTLRQRLELFIHVCDGVQHAHQKAIIHRDLKPTNILVGEVDGRPVPRIIDFGLAKATAQPLTPETLFTRAGVIVGTPTYMSPEQADSTGMDVDTRTDVYSLGVVLYELLVGEVPLDFRKLAFDEILRRMREEEASKPSAKLRTRNQQSSTASKNRGSDSPTLARQLRGDLDAITLKALEKDRSRRYASPSDLAADIARYLRNDTVLAHAPSAAYRTRKYIRRHWVGVAAVAGLLVVLTSFGVAQTLQLRRITRERDRADRIAAFMTGMFKVSDPSTARGNSITAREILDKASREIDTGLSRDPEMQAQMMQTMANVYDQLGLYPQEQSLLTHAFGIRRRVLGTQNPDTLVSMYGLGRNLVQQGHYAEAEKVFRETRDIQRRVLGPEHPETLASMGSVAGVLMYEGRYAESEKLGRQTLDIERRVLGPEHPGTLTTMANLAMVLEYEGRYADAEKLCRETLDIERRVLGPENRHVLMSMSILAVLLDEQGRHSEAEKLHREALNTQRRILGPEHPETLRSTTNLALALMYEGRYAEAEKLDREVLVIRRRVSGPEHPDTAGAAYNLACALARRGDRDEAFSLLRDAVDHGLGPRGDLAIEKDSDLESLHGDPRFAALVAHAKERAAAAR
jgi:serine/threonine protein kinase